MKKSKILALIFVPALLFVCSVTLSACGGHKHDYGYGLGGAKPWEQSCACGHKTGNIDYTKMSMAQFYAEMLKNEGNYKIEGETEGKPISSDDWSFTSGFEVNGKVSYSTSTRDSESSKYYKIITENGAALQYSFDEFAGDTDWNATVADNNLNVWIDYDAANALGWMFTSGYSTSASYSKNGNVYTLQSSALTAYGMTSCTITFNKENIKMNNAWSGNSSTATYTITLGNCPTIELPEEVQKLHDTVMMFELVPSGFGYTEHSNNYWWQFDGEYGTHIDRMIEILEVLDWELCDCTDDCDFCDSWGASDEPDPAYVYIRIFPTQAEITYYATNGSGYSVNLFKAAA
ncbi:MAG: hypothetical protein FWE53_05325 [Firmicutes bacterium]|nr:hypothetical protein [Bacillota bacterium]